MGEKNAFLFAGQGSQKTGMGQDFYNEYSEFRNVFDKVKLDFDIKDVCFNNNENMLLNTRYTQPCMVGFACGVANILKAHGINPNYTCGLSLGEYSALYAADVWSLEDTMKIISVRGEAMAEASDGIDSLMVAITSLSKEKVEECCEKAKEDGIVSICNLNCPGQVVIGGVKKAVDAATQYAKEAGARRCVPLAVSGPFHTEYMRPAGEKLEDVLSKISFKEASCEVLYNYLGGPNNSELSIKELLVNQIQHTVRMQDCIEYLICNDVKEFVEIGPGATISGFVKKTLKSMGKNEDEYSIVSISEVEELKNYLEKKVSKRL